MSIRVRSIDLRVLNMRVRMPFRYGIVTLEALPHLFVRARCEVDGQAVQGVSAEHLPPKWFTKNPESHVKDDLVEMIDCIRAACGHAVDVSAQETPAEWWKSVYASQARWAAGKPYPPLLWGFGVSLVERAMIDAFCRGRGTTFASALSDDAFGLSKAGVIRSVELLPSKALSQVIPRHTVGLIDPLTASEIAPADRVDDGLPQALDDVIRTYGVRHFKIKLGGNVEQDAARLRGLADLIGQLAPWDFAFSLDANENFKSVEPFRALWTSLSADKSLTGFLSRLIFVEQPLHRDVALSAQVKQALHNWPDRPPLIIDESDGELTSLRTALDCGYVGTSHKNCKGIFKSIANAAHLEDLRRRNPGKTYILSGEDLSNVGPVALLQDLVVASSLGIESIERNGQHYFRGMSMFPRDLQQQMLAKHGDLYRWHERGFATIAIDQGRLHMESLLQAPFGVGLDLDAYLDSLETLDNWRFESLGLK